MGSNELHQSSELRLEGDGEVVDDPHDAWHTPATFETALLLANRADLPAQSCRRPEHRDMQALNLRHSARETRGDSPLQIAPIGRIAFCEMSGGRQSCR